MAKLIESLKNCFSEEKVNTGRQDEMDMARAIPVFCLPFVHTFIECTPIERLYDPLPFFFNIVIGQPLGAPMFVFAMGACIHYAKKCTPQDFMKRGLILFIAGFLLNFLRFGLPYLLGYAINHDAEKYLTPWAYKVFGNDILQFAGLFFLLFGLLSYLKIPDLGILGISAVMSVIGSLVRHVDMGVPALNIALGHFIGTQDAAELVMSDFPLINWFMLPVMGYIFGKFLIRMKDKATFYKILSPIPFVAYIIFFILEYVYGIGQNKVEPTVLASENCYYHILWYDVVGFAVFAIGVFGVYYFLMNVFPEPVKRFVNSLSRNITRVYVIHWLFVVILTNVVLYTVRGTQDLPIGPTFLLSVVIFGFTYPLALLWESASKKRRAK